MCRLQGPYHLTASELLSASVVPPAVLCWHILSLSAGGFTLQRWEETHWLLHRLVLRGTSPSETLAALSTACKVSSRQGSSSSGRKGGGWRGCFFQVPSLHLPSFHLEKEKSWWAATPVGVHNYLLGLLNPL